jgi:hypothetical protein
MNTRCASTIMEFADPATAVAVDELWADAEGQATHEPATAPSR